MVVTLDCQQLVELQTRLRTFVGSEKTCGELSTKINFAGISDCWATVDDWPDAKAVIVRNDWAVPMVPGCRCYLNVFATDHHALKTLLQYPGVINWSEKISFFGIPSGQSAVIRNVLEERQIPFSVCLHATLLKITRDKLQLRSVPEGFKLGSLQPEHSALVNSSWKFSSGGDSIPHISHLIETYPSLCMYNQDGDVIGWYLQKENTFLGMLHVREKYRGNGYGKILVSQLAKMCLETMDYVCAFSETENIASLKVHEDAGFDVVGSYFSFTCN